MESQFSQGLLVREAGTENVNENGRYEFEGVISDNSVDSDFTRMSFDALKSFAKTCGEGKGVPVLPEHDRSKQPLGRSISGHFDPKTGQVTAKAFITPGLELNGAGYANTESYIKSMKTGTTTDLSIGAKVNKETCDICSSDMKRASFLGMQVVWCEKAHYPGQKLYRDSTGKYHTKNSQGRTEKVVTSTIEKAELKEFSSVTMGANAQAQIVSRAKDAVKSGNLEKELKDIPLAVEDVLYQISDRYGIVKSELDEIIPLGGNTMSDDRNKTIDDTKNAPTLEISDLQNELANVKKSLAEREDLHKTQQDTISQLNKQVESLEEELGKYEAMDDTIESLEDQVKKEQEEKNAYAERIEGAQKLEGIQEKYQVALTIKRDTVMVWYEKSRSTNATPDEVQRYRKHLDTIDDYALLHDYEVTYRNQVRKNRSDKTSPGTSSTYRSKVTTFEIHNNDRYR